MFRLLGSVIKDMQKKRLGVIYAAQCSSITSIKLDDHHINRVFSTINYPYLQSITVINIPRKGGQYLSYMELFKLLLTFKIDINIYNYLADVDNQLLQGICCTTLQNDCKIETLSSTNRPIFIINDSIRPCHSVKFLRIVLQLF
ncbi:unnamed protein product [Didymodactylos carnosus]|uniref:Uncharacterized protein n=1 Tax=Didymodactylos carnosus TaxID=1234261 RepID=A0A815HV28_9BILA|nr:unnamed protein product [Didymodactylos carnosus]CAF1430892.1 unnamed protein product [Didymodactylos carnosus]CAF4228995.1 unnamed protein product [Didymodactylos carnosus]CAF4230825.1 unnamed protein product [Didymodactylos carnosus]